jgi:hypothetical protein
MKRVFCLLFLVSNVAFSQTSKKVAICTITQAILNKIQHVYPTEPLIVYSGQPSVPFADGKGYCFTSFSKVLCQTNDKYEVDSMVAPLINLETHSFPGTLDYNFIATCSIY